VRWLAPGLLFALAGCGSLFHSDQPPVTVYALRAPDAPALAPRLNVSLAVAYPLAAPGLAADRIAVTMPDGRFDGYAGVRWAAPVPEIVAALLVETLRARGGFAAVLAEGADFGARYLLQAEVREFTAVYSGPGRPPVVHVVLVGELVRSRNRELIQSFSARGEAEARDDHQRAVVAAFATAAGSALTALTDATHAACIAAEAAAAP
jgi:cholesterol transport system auxiliary component